VVSQGQVLQPGSLDEQPSNAEGEMQSGDVQVKPRQDETA
jgi:hypothetical protein